MSSRIRIKNGFAAAVAAMLWLATTLSAAYWVQVTNAPHAAALPAKPHSPAVGVPDAETAATMAIVAGLLGARQTATPHSAPVPADRFSLLGVIADSSGRGAALISVDGKAAQPFRVGAKLADGVVLVAVAADRAMLAEKPNLPPGTVLVVPPWRQTAAGAGAARVQASAQNGVQVAASRQAGLAETAADSNANLNPNLNANLDANLNAKFNAVASSAASEVQDMLLIPARADARRLPQNGLRRGDQRTP